MAWSPNRALLRLLKRPSPCVTRTKHPGSLVNGRARLHLAPPFLLDDPYIPRYLQLSSVDAALKRSRAYAHLRQCNLCPRLCGVNRYETLGMCMIGEKVKVNVIAPHFGEEPCIQGHNGSGSVFFSMCNLRCTFCQNYDISHVRNGEDLTPEELAEWYIKLQNLGGVHNINLVTPEHVVPQVALSILTAAEMGLRIPIVYNTSAYDSLESLRLLDGLVDIYLPDFKLWSSAESKRLLKAEDYPDAAKESIKEMHKQVGDLCFTPDGIARRGLLVRHLIMPGLTAESEEIMKWLSTEVSKDTFVNLMDQYRPAANVGKAKKSRLPKGAEATTEKEPSSGQSKEAVRYADINRAITNDELTTVRKAAESAGLWRFCDPPKHGGFHI
ncbi:hypothetical protein PpBr36_02906 [Pyricularia pennisetigena]|uniref:hypothetical protein n=1 Tax=Pyricularia pennisetigena TaxID=1578925 RepID=UPI0011535D26|nr:hypothetical protein PpBr36_02906 [Pyricularia pennisetigena]TLS30489.1 hypothetical protein PpBr36_02906 [Pyricularia pennisetigena]